jgi:Mg/Co/Ni transporter MgtE
MRWGGSGRYATIFRGELATGLITGGLIGVAFYLFARAIWGKDDVAAAVAISIAVSCSIATVVAMALPALLIASIPIPRTAPASWRR